MPETKIIILPDMEFEHGDQALEFIKNNLNELVPAEVEFDKKIILVDKNNDDNDNSSDNEFSDNEYDYCVIDGYYFIFILNDTHYHVIIRNIFL